MSYFLLISVDARKDQEMNNFISLLDTTLKLNKENDKSDDDKEGEDDDDDGERTLTPANLMPCNNRTYVVAKRPVDEVDDIGGQGDMVSERERQVAPVVTFAAMPVNIIDPNVPLPARTSKNVEKPSWCRNEQVCRGGQKE